MSIMCGQFVIHRKPFTILWYKLKIAVVASCAILSFKSWHVIVHNLVQVCYRKGDLSVESKQGSLLLFAPFHFVITASISPGGGHCCGLPRQYVMRDASGKGSKRSHPLPGKYTTKPETRSQNQERPTLICWRSSALSACLTKAAGVLCRRIRLVAFLWLLTSGAFGLHLESQWSNGHVCHFMEQSIDCG